MIGFETIGNATIICYDNTPVLVTDPWIAGSAYFGSWGMSHQIPKAQMAAVLESKYAWFSHAHPDHLNGESLHALRDKTILLPKHVGDRVFKDLTEMGFSCRVLPEREWVDLSRHIRIFCATDRFQNAALLIDLKGTLLINLNDCIDRGWGWQIRRIARNYKRVFLLKLSGFGDADMINFFDEDGNRIPSRAAYNLEHRQVGKVLSLFADLYHATHVVPFSSFHRYQREDSVWASKYTTPVSAYRVGFNHSKAEILDPYISFDCEKGSLRYLNPDPNENVILPPSDFGDDWQEHLDRDDVRTLDKYIRAKEKLADYFSFISFRVGGKDTVIDLAKHKFRRGITFEAPRGSLMKAVQYEVFDDLLIGNFMKTTLHGCDGLYPHFNPIVPKYADNGRAQTRDEVQTYLAEYRKRAPIQYIVCAVEEDTHRLFRKFVNEDTPLFKAATKVYSLVRP